MASRLLLIGFLFFYPVFLWSQNHVYWLTEWDAEIKAVTIDATIDRSWHMYSPLTDPNLGPIPVTFTWEKNKNAKPIDEFVFSSKTISHYDPNFEGNVYTWENKMFGYQRFKIKKPTTIKGKVSYMVCDETKCLPPIEVEISVILKP